MSCHPQQPHHPRPAARRSVPSCQAEPDPTRSRSARELSRLTQFIAEVLAGQRDPAQLRTLLSRSAYELLQRRAGVYSCARSPRVRRTFLHPAEPDVTEVSAVIDCGSRHRALALRVAFTQQTWLCTHVETDVGRR